MSYVFIRGDGEGGGCAFLSIEKTLPRRVPSFWTVDERNRRRKTGQERSGKRRGKRKIKKKIKKRKIKREKRERERNSKNKEKRKVWMVGTLIRVLFDQSDHHRFTDVT